MSPLEQLFRLEIEFNCRLRVQAPGTGDTASLHTSCALQSGYETLLRNIGTVSLQDIETMRERLTLAGDVRDLLAARDSLRQLLRLSLIDS
jgi:hypothetical protein